MCDLVKPSYTCVNSVLLNQAVIGVRTEEQLEQADKLFSLRVYLPRVSLYAGAWYECDARLGNNNNNTVNNVRGADIVEPPLREFIRFNCCVRFPI